MGPLRVYVSGSYVRCGAVCSDRFDWAFSIVTRELSEAVMLVIQVFA